MTYNGLKISDKDALLDAKARGAEWVARDEFMGEINGFIGMPRRERADEYWLQPTGTSWNQTIPIDKENLQFVQWENPEPVNIDLALAQIAEMESAEKPNGCDVCRGIKILSGTFHGIIRVDDETQMEVDSDGDVDFAFCPVCGRNLNSPYTEGDTDEG